MHVARNSVVAVMALAILTTFCLQAVAAPINLYVASTGSDSWAGDRSAPNAKHTDGPLATLTAAQSRVRAILSRGDLPPGPVTVWLSGTYELDTPWTLSAQDSGASSHPVIYRAMSGQKAELTGGRGVSSWAPVTDSDTLSRLPESARGHVLVADLQSKGITDYGAMTRRGFGMPVVPAGLELFFNGRPMTLARWPSVGWARITAVSSTPGGADLTSAGDLPSTLASESDLWVYGYWAFDWADDYLPIASVDTTAHTFHVAPPEIPLGGATAGARFYFLNVLSELNQPGEWYLDRKGGKLYFWPPAPIKSGRAMVSLGQDIIQMSGVSDVSIEGIAIDVCRANGISLTNCSHCRIAGCAIENIGNTAVSCFGATDVGIVGCDISQCGDGGVILSGGDRHGLIPGNNFVDDCHISDFSRWSRTYRPAVQLYGVANRVTHNLIENAPHSAIIISGNDHEIAYNDIGRVCMDTADAGAFYIGRDWSMRGNVVRYNYFHDIGGPKADLRGWINVNAIYLDDCSSGTTAYGNICANVQTGLQLGGGRDNTVQNNVFVNCVSAFLVDGRGLTWAKQYMAPGSDWNMQGKLADIHYDQPPYSTKYPGLADILSDHPEEPKGNVISGNIVSGGGPKWMDMSSEATPYIDVHNNLTGIGVKLLPGRGLRFAPLAPVLQIHFAHIPVDKIGLYPDADRALLPTVR